MKLFDCQRCGQLLYFDNTRCESCGSTLGYLPERRALSALDQHGDDLWRPAGHNTDDHFRFCSNARYGGCNWLLPERDQAEFCRACVLNRTVPDLSDARQQELWQRLESAKHRLVYSILRLGLPLVSKVQDEARGLAFDFLADSTMTFRDGPEVMTGHANGLITINLAEADDAIRERARQDMAEPYRTILGHFRHEVGHYYWERLVQGGDRLGSFRSLFGDERQDYGESLAAHHADGAPANWQSEFVSAYATAHPWEDFAECWAHYMHIVDTLETAFAFRLKIEPVAGDDRSLDADVDFDAYREKDFKRLFKAWLPVTYAVNSLNESMGHTKLYPFTLAPKVIDKLTFIHDLRLNSATD